MSTCGTVHFHGDGTYAYYERRSGSRHNRTCIDGTVTGCGKCVGYCRFDGHPGFLTAKQRESHSCIEKGCHYYIEKPARERVKEAEPRVEEHLLSAVRELTKDMEGLRVLGVRADGQNRWKVNYISISNAYSLQPVRRALEQMLGCEVAFAKLNYSFERCVQLILAG